MPKHNPTQNLNLEHAVDSKVDSRRLRPVPNPLTTQLVIHIISIIIIIIYI